MSKRKTGKKTRSKTGAAASASAALKGQATTAEREVNVAGMAERAKARQSWLNKPMLGTRITWRAVLLFLLACVMLDGILWAVFELGLGRCYGILCLL